jgi:peptide/nickel transport system ATP-binding protein/oligopeptide transport system ATP-binding protein
MIFQDPMTSLNPVKPVGDQIVEAIRAHERMPRELARRRAGELLAQVGISQARERLDDHPHRFSGGMRQRVMIAMAIACNPDVLIADEPTTALDVTIQAQIFELLARVREETDSAMILITHDLGLAATVARSALVMYGGRIVERGAVAEVFHDPQHPYTWGLLGAIPRLDRPRPRRLYSIGGAPPRLGEAPSGCRFRSRCPHAFDACATEPQLTARGAAAGHEDRCWIAGPARTELRPDAVVGGRVG